METVSSSTADIHSIGKILCVETAGEDEKLEAVKNIKKLFKNPSRSFLNVSLASLINNANLTPCLEKCDKNFLFNFGMSIINYFGRDFTFNKQLFGLLELVLMEFKNQQNEVLETLVSSIWGRFQSIYFYDSEIFERMLYFSKNYLENIVLDWIEDSNFKWESNFYFKASAMSREIFQALTTILYQVAIKSQGNLKILEFINIFVSTVMVICEKEQRNFLKLYPKDCYHLVSLLMTSPKVYPEGKETEKLVTKKLVSRLLLDKLFEDSSKTLMLLTHFPEWLCVLKNYLSEVYT